MTMDSTEGMIEKVVHNDRLIMEEAVDSPTVRHQGNYQPRVMITFQDFCTLMGYKGNLIV